LRRRRTGVLMRSATLEGERVAAHVGGLHLSASGRAFPVDVRYLPGRDVLPSASDLPARVQLVGSGRRVEGGLHRAVAVIQRPRPVAHDGPLDTS